jgi:hypothetical protein
MMRALLVVLAVVLTASASASAATPLPVGKSDGVRVDRRHGAIRVTFDKKLHRRLAGKRVEIWCRELADPDAIGLVETSSGGSTYRVPRKRRWIGTGDATRGIDYCRVWRSAHRVKRRRVGRNLIASVPLTQRGAVHLDEELKTAGLFGLLILAGELGHRNEYPTPAELLAGIRKETGETPEALVAMSLPADTPAAGLFGYYSDGVKHVAVVTLSAAGRRLFIEVSADRTLSTNVSEYIYSYGEFD